MSGYVFQLCWNTIYWRSWKQISEATSTVEAEYIAQSWAAKQSAWLHSALLELALLELALLELALLELALLEGWKPNAGEAHTEVALVYCDRKTLLTVRNSRIVIG